MFCRIPPVWQAVQMQPVILLFSVYIQVCSKCLQQVYLLHFWFLLLISGGKAFRVKLVIWYECTLHCHDSGLAKLEMLTVNCAAKGPRNYCWSGLLLPLQVQVQVQVQQLFASAPWSVHPIHLAVFYLHYSPGCCPLCSHIWGQMFCRGKCWWHSPQWPLQTCHL